jgi:hypothetical protein
MLQAWFNVVFARENDGFPRSGWVHLTDVPAFWWLRVAGCTSFFSAVGFFWRERASAILVVVLAHEQ